MYDVFSLPSIQFPGNFLWGSATAGHQIEGDNIHSQNWHDEQQASFWDDDPEHKFKAVSGKADDSYRLYREDVNLLASLGHQAYRMSIEWSRIEPAAGEWNQDAVDHYVDLLSLLNEKGIQPFVTLHHFTHPYWFEQLGAFQKRENLRYFERYLKFLLPQISSHVAGWNVFNEFNLGPALTTPEVGSLKFNMLRAHTLGYHLIKAYSQAPVSTAHAYIHWFPRRFHDSLDQLMTGYMDFISNEFFFHALRTGEMVFPNIDAEFDADMKGAVDFWAVNYYTRHMVDARNAHLEGKRFDHKQMKMIPMNFYLEEMFPEGLTAALERLNDLPVYITENGCAATDDRFRIVYIALTLSAIQEAIQHGVDVKGYFYWSLLDNYEWGSYIPQFGLVSVNRATFERTPKPSAAFYRDVIEHNGFGGETVSKYLSELPTLEKQRKSSPQLRP